MTQIPPTIHIMTAGFTPGDAISNFMISSGRILRDWGARVYFYADSVAPAYGAIARHSRYYPQTGHDFLWYHYSIYADNLEIALASADRKIMDFHGICPPELFTGQNEHLAGLCATGLRRLPEMHDAFDSYVVHSDYVRDWLQKLDFPPELIIKIPLCIDTSIYTGSDPALAASLGQLDYFLMVGRIVPQKDILALIEIFSHIQRQRPNTALIIAGSRQHTPKYQRQIDRLIARRGLQDRAILTGQISNTTVLEALFQQAKLLFVTSEWESFCVPVAESLHFSVPAVVHDLPPLPEVAGPGGLVIDKADPAAAAAAVLTLLADDGRYAQMQQAARSWAARYQTDALRENLALLFSKLPRPHKGEND